MAQVPTVATFGNVANKTPSGETSYLTSKSVTIGDKIILCVAADSSPSAARLLIVNPFNPIVSTGTGSSTQALVYGTRRKAQIFEIPGDIAGSTGFYGIQFALSKNGTPVGTTTLALYAVDGSNKPTGSALATATFAESGLSASWVWVTFIFASPPSVAANTKYAAVVYSSGSDAANCLAVNSSFTPSQGSTWKSTDSGSSWVAEDEFATGLGVIAMILPSTGTANVSTSFAKDAEANNSGNTVASVWSLVVPFSCVTNATLYITNSVATAMTAYLCQRLYQGTANYLDETKTATGLASGSPSSGATATLGRLTSLGISVIGVEGPTGDTAGSWTTGASNISGNELTSGTLGGSAATNQRVFSAAEVLYGNAAQTGAKTGMTARDWAALTAIYRVRTIPAMTLTGTSGRGP